MRTRGWPCQHLWIRAGCRLERHGRKSLADLSGRRPSRSRPLLAALPGGAGSSLAYDLIGLSSAVAILVAVHRHRLARPLLWWCFAIGQLLFVIGDVLYAVIEQVLHQSPFPSIADGFYLAGYPILAAGLLILIRGRISGRDRAGLIDAAIIANGLGLLSWTFLMKPIAADPSLSLTERLISLAYPLGDVLLLVMWLGWQPARAPARSPIGCSAWRWCCCSAPTSAAPSSTWSAATRAA